MTRRGKGRERHNDNEWRERRTLAVRMLALAGASLSASNFRCDNSPIRTEVNIQERVIQVGQAPTSQVVRPSLRMLQTIPVHVNSRPLRVTSDRLWLSEQFPHSRGRRSPRQPMDDISSHWPPVLRFAFHPNRLVECLVVERIEIAAKLGKAGPQPASYKQSYEN